MAEVSIPDIAATLGVTPAAVHLAQSQALSALQPAATARTTSTPVLGHPLVATLRALGYYKPAHQLAEDTLTRLRRVLGDDHPHTLRSAHGLSSTTSDR